MYELYLYLQHKDLECGNTHTAYLIGNRHPKKDNTCGIEGGTTMTSFRNTVHMRTPITVVQKAQQYHRISTHLMMAK
jgi:hypothetical protein